MVCLSNRSVAIPVCTKQNTEARVVNMGPMLTRVYLDKHGIDLTLTTAAVKTTSRLRSCVLVANNAPHLMVGFAVVGRTSVRPAADEGAARVQCGRLCPRDLRCAGLLRYCAVGGIRPRAPVRSRPFLHQVLPGHAGERHSFGRVCRLVDVKLGAPAMWGLQHTVFRCR